MKELNAFGKTTHDQRTGQNPYKYLFIRTDPNISGKTTPQLLTISQANKVMLQKIIGTD